MKEVFLDAAAENDLLEIWAYIAYDDPPAADRVVEAAYEVFEMLRKNPGLGVAHRFRNRKLQGTRRIVISDFPNYLIFYRETNRGIEIIRVVHGARDIDRLE